MTRTCIATGYYRCPVCNKRHSESLLLHSQLQAVFADPEAFLGWALCPKDEVLQSMGFVALVEVPPDTDLDSADTAAEQLETVPRTGNVFHVLRERWATVLNHPEPPPEIPLIFVEPDVVASLFAQNRKALH